MIHQIQDLLFEVVQAEGWDLKHCCIINGVASSSLLKLKQRLSDITIVQPHAGKFKQLQSQNIPVTPTIHDGFSSVLYIGGKSKAEHEQVFSKVFAALPDGSLFIMVLPNTLGAARFEKVLFSLHPAHTFSHSKQKCRVFGITNFQRAMLDDHCVAVLSQGEGNVFNKGALDEGSAFLSTTLSGKLSGEVAEFCSGSGALTEALSHNNPAIEKLICFESDFNAYEQSKRLANHAIEFQWQDVTEFNEKRFNTIVMNPPFHDSYGENLELGFSCIFAGIRSLNAGGTMFVVQNKHLPYLKDTRLKDKYKIIDSTNRFIVWSYAA